MLAKGTLFFVALFLFLGGSVEAKKSRRCPKGMILIKGGSFWRGSRTASLDETPRRKIFIKSFCLDKTEVIMKHYRRCVRAGKCKAAKVSPRYSSLRPVVGVSWFDAKAFCRWAGKRLPTEAEWEKAARGDRPHARYPVFGRLTCRKANFGALYPCAKGHPHVARKPRHYKAGPFGLYDMAGNVFEWVADCYSPDYYKRSPTKNPLNKRCQGDQAHVLRGGSLSSPPQDLRITARQAAWAKGTFLDVGFRCASDPK